MRRVLTALLALAVLAAPAGCGRSAEPYHASREVLGTAVSVTAYPGDAPAVREAVDGAFSRMRAIEHALSPYDASSTISAFNRAPHESHDLPPEALAILRRTEGLGVVGQFSPALFGITRLYDFGGAGAVPSAPDLSYAVREAASFQWAADGRARFVPDLRRETSGSPRPGLDFGGASKGLALDAAIEPLRGVVSAGGALISAGSSTLAFGSKPDGEPWRVGIEDPREPGRVVALVSSSGPETLSVSTSGDYQVYFDRDGVRYHHILDPATGLPVRGLRSITVFGRMSGLDADILSTALFVMGRDRALAYARAHGTGVYLIDDRGSSSAYAPPGVPGVTLEEKASPRS